MGDFLDKPLAHGGLVLSRYTVTGVLLIVIVFLIFIFPQNAIKKGH